MTQSVTNNNTTNEEVPELTAELLINLVEEAKQCTKRYRLNPNPTRDAKGEINPDSLFIVEDSPVDSPLKNQ